MSLVISEIQVHLSWRLGACRIVRSAGWRVGVSRNAGQKWLDRDAKREKVCWMKVVPKGLNVQYAVLPWRKAGNAVEILLITTLNTHRWIVPKGWPLDGKTPSATAAQEAMEEAGISGEIATTPLGSFHYNKLRKNGDTVSCKVDVFPMKVSRQRRSWDDKKIREVRWYSVDEALARVSEPGLRRLISKFAGVAAKPAARAASR
jgi:8-oxo-dGTP pyrophosphatase MutT (NUDIX family)